MPFPVQHPDDAYYSPEKGDVWALGVILVNLIARCNPWARGSNADHGFMEYRRDPNFFSKTLPISYSVQALLHRIFVLDPEERITVAELRKAIVAIDTFFLSDMQLSLAGDLVKALHEAYKLNLPGPKAVSSTGSLIKYQAPSMFSTFGEVLGRRLDGYSQFTLASTYVGEESSSSTSSESSGPRTPEAATRDLPRSLGNSKLVMGPIGEEGIKIVVTAA